MHKVLVACAILLCGIMTVVAIAAEEKTNAPPPTTATSEPVTPATLDVQPLDSEGIYTPSSNTSLRCRDGSVYNIGTNDANPNTRGCRSINGSHAECRGVGVMNVGARCDTGCNEDNEPGTCCCNEAEDRDCERGEDCGGVGQNS